MDDAFEDFVCDQHKTDFIGVNSILVDYRVYLPFCAPHICICATFLNCQSFKHLVVFFCLYHTSFIERGIIFVN